VSVACIAFATLFAGAAFDDGASAALERFVDDYLEARVKERKFSGVVLVAKDGKPLLRKAYGFADWTTRTPSTPDTGFMIFSLTKQFTAAAVLRLQDRGAFSVADKVSKHVADWPKEWDAVTLHHLLSHSSGIDVDTLYFWLVKHHPKFWEDPKQPMPKYEPRPLLSDPGKVFRYSNAGYTVLSLVVEKATGKPFAEALQDEVFKPLGMSRTVCEGAAVTPGRARGHALTSAKAEISEQKTHFIQGAGEVVTTVDDLLKWNITLDGDTFLSPAAKAAMFTRHVKGRTGGMGYGWQIRDGADGRPLPVFGGSGAGFNCFVVRKPHGRLFVAVLCNREADGPFPYALDVLAKTEALLDGKP
jgi:D-alanyl-D-alanine carboxypeptidase